MSKTELVEFIANKAGLTKADAARALDACLEGITSGLKKEGKVAFERYKGLLKAGGSKYPTVEAKEAGVDFEDPNTFLAVTNRLETLVNELEELIK